MSIIAWVVPDLTAGTLAKILLRGGGDRRASPSPARTGRPGRERADRDGPAAGGRRVMRTGTCITLIAVGAILRFAIASGERRIYQAQPPVARERCVYQDDPPL